MPFNEYRQNSSFKIIFEKEKIFTEESEQQNLSATFSHNHNYKTLFAELLESARWKDFEDETETKNLIESPNEETLQNKGHQRRVPHLPSYTPKIVFTGASENTNKILSDDSIERTQTEMTVSCQGSEMSNGDSTEKSIVEQVSRLNQAIGQFKTTPDSCKFHLCIDIYKHVQKIIAKADSAGPDYVEKVLKGLSITRQQADRFGADLLQLVIKETNRRPEQK